MRWDETNRNGRDRSLDEKGYHIPEEMDLVELT